MDCGWWLYSVDTTGAEEQRSPVSNAMVIVLGQLGRGMFALPRREGPDHSRV